MNSFYHITLWYRYDELNKCFVFNHLEFGWNYLKKPVPMFPAQKVWNKLRWSKQFSVMDTVTNVVA